MKEQRNEDIKNGQIAELINSLKYIQLNGPMEQCVNRRHRRHNLPAELVVEIVDSLPLENAVHFLASVPNPIIIHHCSPRIRRMLETMDQIAVDYVRTLPKPNIYGRIRLINGLQYTPAVNIFMRYGGAHCEWLSIWGRTSDGFVDYPANFFNDLIKYYYETDVPTKGVRRLFIDLSWANPAPWPAALVQPQMGKMDVEELKVKNGKKWVEYILRNKHRPSVKFKFCIIFEGDAKCYQHMTHFNAYRIKSW